MVQAVGFGPFSLAHGDRRRPFAGKARSYDILSIKAQQ